LRFTANALDAIAEMAIERKIGARGLRLITEDLMLDAMYELPSTKNVTEFVVTREMVESKDVVLKLLEKTG
jgi:ATP-dependent Clp protease ATP-binding subunit ClpX